MVTEQLDAKIARGREAARICATESPRYWTAGTESCADAPGSALTDRRSVPWLLQLPTMTNPGGAGPTDDEMANVDELDKDAQMPEKSTVNPVTAEGVSTVASAAVARSEVVAQQEHRAPIATFALLALLTVVFGVEHWVKLGGQSSGLLGVDIPTLIVIGGMHRALVLEQGEWYRLLTAALLHLDLLHLLFNALALALAGVLLESLLGRAWLLLLYFVGALGGSLMGLAINPVGVVSVGASGAIMGVLAAVFIVAMRFPAGPERSAIQGQSLRFLLPSLIPMATQRSGSHTDYAAHFGGALAGLAAGWVALRLWPKDQRQLRCGGTITLLAGAGAAAFLVGGSVVAANFRSQSEVQRILAADLLVKDEAIPKNTAAAKAEVEKWGMGHPRDPRVHLFRALKLLDEENFAAAEIELRAALVERTVLARMFPNGLLDTSLRTLLAQVLVHEGRQEEAKQVALPRCKSADGSIPELLRDLHVCE